MNRQQILHRVAFLSSLIIGNCAGPGMDRLQAQNSADGAVRLPITLEADQRSELRARVAGYVGQVHVDIGDRVNEGQLLVTLDAPELEVDVKRRQQLVVQAESNLGVAKGRVATALAKLRQVDSARNEHQAMRQLRISQRDRYATLVRGGAVQQEKLEEAEFGVMAIDAGLAKVDADAEAARADVDAAKQEVEFAKSGIEVAKAELALAEAQNQLRQIKAPFAGLVTARNVDTGELVNPGNMSATPLLVVEHVDVLRGVMTVPAKEAVTVRVGDAVDLIGFGDGEILGPGGEKLTVSRLSQALDMTTRTMRIEIDLGNSYEEEQHRYRFLSGQYGSASIQTR